MKILNGIVCAVVLGTAASASAQPAMRRDQREINQDRRELRQDAAARRDDWRDLKRLEGALSRFDNARATSNAMELRWVDDEVRGLLSQELAEGRAELAKDKAEVRRDVREVRGDAREVRRDEFHGAGYREREDRRDMRDDRRDLHKDVQDVRAEKENLRRTWWIANEYDGLYGRMDPNALAQKRALITELIGLARQELRQDNREMREDRHELREDRREQREDWRQRR